jgi:DNA polymerase
MKINIVNVKEAVTECWSWDFYLGRANKTYQLSESCLANPLTIKKESDRDSVIAQYDDWLYEQIQDPMGNCYEFLTEITQFLLAEGEVTLSCHCSPKRCHIEIVAQYIIDYLKKYPPSEGFSADQIEVVYKSNKKQRKTSYKIKQNPLQKQWAETYNLRTCQSCDQCELAQSRTHTVWIRGEGKKKLLIVGEAPGQNEDELALPFIGDSGRMLEVMLSSIGMNSQEDTWIVNAVKCRPPENRTPSAGEVDSCFPYLQQQIVELQPKVILALGGTSTKRLIGKSDFKISNCRGKVYPLDLTKWNLPQINVDESDYIIDYIMSKSALEKVKVVPTWHPAYLLRNPQKEVSSPKWQAWQDLQLVKKLLEEI